jgi:hypothetical protein
MQSPQNQNLRKQIKQNLRMSKRRPLSRFVNLLSSVFSLPADDVLVLGNGFTGQNISSRSAF